MALNDYQAYHSDKYGMALQSLPDSIGNVRAVLGSTGRAIDFVKMPAVEFEKRFIKAEVVLPNKSSRRLTPQEAVAKMLDKARKLPITQSALERIEAMFQTKGKSTAEIRAEILRLANELPDKHALREVPATYPDRSQAIAAYTLVRQTLFQLNSKEKVMTDATVTEAVPAKRTRKAATKNGTTPEAKRPSKAKVTNGNGEAAQPAKRGRKAKVVAAPEPAPAKRGRKAAEAPAPAKRGRKAAEAPKKERAPRTEAPSAYKVAGDAVNVKDTSELGMQQGSARTAVMNVVLSNKKRKSFTMDDFAKIEGAASALRYLVARGYLAAA